MSVALAIFETKIDQDRRVCLSRGQMPDLPLELK